MNTLNGKNIYWSVAMSAWFMFNDKGQYENLKNGVCLPPAAFPTGDLFSPSSFSNLNESISLKARKQLAELRKEVYHAL